VIEIKAAIAAGIAALSLNVFVDVAGIFIAAAGAAAAAGYMWRILRRAAKTYDVIEGLPAWQEQARKDREQDRRETHERLDSIDGRLHGLEKRAGAVQEPVEAIARDLGVEHRQQQ